MSDEEREKRLGYLAALVRRERTRRKWSLLDLAKQAQLHLETIRKVENKKGVFLETKTIERLAQALGRNPQDLQKMAPPRPIRQCTEPCSCGSRKRVHRNKETGRPMCASCFVKQRIGICVDCQEAGDVTEKRIRAANRCSRHYPPTNRTQAA